MRSRPRPVRVRIGIHTGEPIRTDEGYVGMDVYRAARIAAAGHGGQILLSRATYELVDPEGILDLGMHRLKEVGEVHLYQADDRSFPPVVGARSTNLPEISAGMLGREHEREDSRHARNRFLRMSCVIWCRPACGVALS